MPLNTASQYAEFYGVSDAQKCTLETYALNFNWKNRLLVNKSWFHIYFYCPLLNPEM